MAFLVLEVWGSPAAAAGAPSATPLRPTGRPGSTGTQRGHGKLLPVLPNGTPVEPSTDRAEFTESAEILKGGEWDWNVDVVGGAVDRFSALQTKAIEWMHAEVRHGIGDGLELSARAESWDQVAVQQGTLGQTLQESGYGPTTLTVRQRLTAGGKARVASCVGVHVRLAGASDGPGTHVAEGGVFVPMSFPLGEDTHLGTTFEGDVVSDASDTGHHLEGVSSLELSHDVEDRLSLRCEAVSIWYSEAGRPWMGTVDAGLSVDVAPHVGITLGAAAGVRGGTTDLGGFGRLSVHR
jgi:hypothetical protein